MGLIVLTSASGSPGVTTTALGLALAWPRPCLLVDADPTGSCAVLAGYFRAEVSHTGGLIELALAHRQGNLAEQLPKATMRIPDSPAGFLPGIRSHAQSPSLIPLWEPLAGALADLDRNGQDVIVDAGRLGLVACPEPLIRAADVTLLVTRSNLPALAGAKAWSDTLRDWFPAPATCTLGVLIVGQGQPYGPREVAKVLQLPVTASLAWDPVNAEVFSLGAAPARRFDTGALPRSLRAAAAKLQSVLTATRSSLDATPGEKIRV
jgi:hypothetical protein